MSRTGLFFLMAFVSAGSSALGFDDALVVHPAPEGAALRDRFLIEVAVQGGAREVVPTHRIQVNAFDGIAHATRESSMAFFDFGGSVEVLVRSLRGPIESARIRPHSAGIVPEVDGDTLRFRLVRPANLSIEVDGDVFDNLHLFANPLESGRPDPRDPAVIWFGPGIHDAGARSLDGARAPGIASATELRPNPTYNAAPPGGVLRVPSNTTVYLEGGAIVRGRILCEEVENVRILGRGMIEQGGRGSGIRIANSRRVEVRDLFTPQCFTGGSQHVTISGVRCISWVGNGDGMNVISCSDVLIERVFNRNSDDCVTVYGTRAGFAGDARRITVRGATLWADIAHPILVGTHGSTPHPEVLEDLSFIDLDILDHHEPQLDYQGCLAINAGDSNLVRRVLFEDVRIDDFRRGQLVNLRVFYNRKYCTSPGRGIEDVTFRRVSYDGTRASNSIIAGYDDARKVRGIVFEDLVINGLEIHDGMRKPAWYKTADMAGIFVGEHVEGLVFVRSNPQPEIR
jgi:hypothetical protein